MKFFANALFCGELVPGEGVIGLVAGETETGDGEVVQISTFEEFSEQDERLGQDTYCISIGHGEAVHYGGLETWRLVSGRVSFLLERDAAGELGGVGSITIDFDPSKTATVGEWLRKTLQIEPSP